VSGPAKGRFLADIIDTADVLKANGFKPNDTYSFVVGGTALNASNTFRVAGNNQPDLARNSAESYAEEYHTRPDQEGIWRSLKFKNIVLSYGQLPSLADFLVAPKISSTDNPMLKQMAIGHPHWVTRNHLRWSITRRKPKKTRKSTARP
jgi:hypothetical protein